MSRRYFMSVAKRLECSFGSVNFIFCLSSGILISSQKYPGKLHLIADGWTSPNVIAYIGAGITLVIDGKMASIVLDFIK
jgi:hypothetical protein